jgi:hypothetical protein
VGGGGPSGASGAGAQGYQFVQVLADSVWTITHDLGRMCSVTILDESGLIVLADVTFTSVDVVRVDFTEPMAGQAYLV